MHHSIAHLRRAEIGALGDQYDGNVSSGSNINGAKTEDHS
jgi:hypothetical protein